MLDAPIGTASTFWEGMSVDGRFVYGGSYESLAHGWSTAPTAALTSFVLGLNADAPDGSRFLVAPHPGDLTYASGNLRLGPGRSVAVSWRHTARQFVLTVTGRGASGDLAVPTVLGNITRLTLDGQTAAGTRDGGYIRLQHVGPGKHTVRAVLA